MLSTLLVLSGLAASLQVGPTQDTKYWVKLDAGERPAQNGRPPVIIFAGTTNLPHGARLDIEFYYKKFFSGRNLMGKALRVLDGKFSQEVVLYRNSKKNLAGPYVIRIWCYPGQQRPDVRAAMGNEARRNILFEITHHVGTPEEAKAEKEAVYLRMMGLLDKFKAIFETIKETARSIEEGKFDRKAWKVLQGRWEVQALAIEREANAVNEFVALEMDSFVKMHFEVIRTGVLVVSNWTAIALERPNNPNVAQMLQRKRIEMAKLMEEIRKIADPTYGDVDVIIEDMESLKTILLGAMENPGAPSREARTKFFAALSRVQLHAPGELHHVFVSIVAEFRKFFRALPDNLPEARRLQTSLDGRIQSMITSLDLTPKKD